MSLLLFYLSVRNGMVGFVREKIKLVTAIHSLQYQDVETSRYWGYSVRLRMTIEVFIMKPGESIKGLLIYV